MLRAMRVVRVNQPVVVSQEDVCRLHENDDAVILYKSAMSANVESLNDYLFDPVALEPLRWFVDKSEKRYLRHSFIARPVKRFELESNSEAASALQKEWNNLRTIGV